MSEIRQTEPCLLASNLSQMDASMITALLEDSEIPSFIKDHGTGGYMKIYMGYTIYGQDIYVGQVDYAKAKELIDFYFNSNTEGMEEQQDDLIAEDTESKEFVEEKVNSHFFKASTVARIVILLSVISAIAIKIFNNLF